VARAYPGDLPGPIDAAIAAARRARRRLRERRCRLTARPRLLDERRAIVTVLEEFDLLVDREDIGLSQSLMDHGYWEMWLTEALEAALKPGMVAIDIGANLGYFTMLMAKRVGPTGHVHAFEPNPAIADLLRESATLNGFGDRVTVHGAPLWDADGERRVLRIPDREPKNAYLAAADDGAGLALSTRRLDGFCDLLDARVIKIDVEGAEEQVWRGTRGLFARGRPLTVFLEYCPDRYAHPAVFLDAILAEGFTLAELTVSHGAPAVSPEQVLAGARNEDRMLALVRR
jgi:FkbM family methyltransferase